MSELTPDLTTPEEEQPESAPLVQEVPERVIEASIAAEPAQAEAAPAAVEAAPAAPELSEEEKAEQAHKREEERKRKEEERRLRDEAYVELEGFKSAGTAFDVAIAERVKGGLRGEYKTLRIFLPA